MLTLQNKEELQKTKNLLAFSAGGDSTALFFLLLENEIKFDIAIVDYGVRSQSQKEVAYAQQLAREYDIRCYSHTAPKIDSNFEAKAREVRYDFFEELIAHHSYNALLTAHHLGDRFEWFLMQFCKGAGCVELAGMQSKDKRSGYTLYRPLLHLDKQELLHYLHKKNIDYFEDESNSDERYKRNSFRLHHTNPLLKEYLEGIRKSFAYIDEDRYSLIQEEELKRFKELSYFKNPHDKRSSIYLIDKYLKSQGHIITASERALLKKNSAVVLGRKIIVSFHDKYIFIAPFIQEVKIAKKLKEKMRRLRIEPKLRAYLASDGDLLTFVSSLLE